MHTRNGCDVIRVEYLIQCTKSILKIQDKILSCIFKIKILSSRQYLAQHYKIRHKHQTEAQNKSVEQQATILPFIISHCYTNWAGLQKLGLIWSGNLKVHVMFWSSLRQVTDKVGPGSEQCRSNGIGLNQLAIG